MSDQLLEWLRALDLEHLAPLFEEHQVAFRDLPLLNDDDLKSLGIALGPRRRLIEAICEEPDTFGTSQRAAAKSQQAEAERRHMTVMFIDLVGSTELTARLDPEEMRTVVRSFQDACAAVINRFEGHIAKYMGDGILAYFGWPQAHEDDADRACRTALEIARGITALETVADVRLAVRVGVASGLVVVGDLIGEGAAREEAIIGDTPNLAARLQSAAGSGRVMIAEQTARLVGGVFEMRDLGTRSLKGYPEPVAVFELVGERSGINRFEARAGLAPTSMVGRDRDMALLMTLWRKATTGRGQGVLLIGEAGIGKSRIARDLADRISSSPRHQVLLLQCSPYHTETALWPIIEQIGRAAGLESTNNPDDRLDRIDALLERTGERNAQAAPLLAHLLRLDGVAARYGTLDLPARLRRSRTFEILTGHVFRMTTRTPVLLLIEDVHWIDPTTLDLIGEWIGRAADARMLIVITCRPEVLPDLPRPPHLTELKVGRLARTDVESIVDRVAGKLLSRRTIDAIADRTDGVPLFVEELTKTIVEGGDAGIPASLHDALMARLDRIPGSKRLAQIAASIGREFHYRLLRRIADKPELELRAALDRLVEAEIVSAIGTPPNTRYTFKHALVQDAAYHSLLKSTRRKLHAEIFDALMEEDPAVAQTRPEVVAHHASEAGLTYQAVEYWGRAGTLAARNAAHGEAATQFMRALTALGTMPDSELTARKELDLRLALGPVLMAQKGYGAPEVEPVYVRARELCERLEDEADRFLIIWGLWLNYFLRSRFREARILLREIEMFAADHPTEDVILQTHHAGWTTLLPLGEYRACRHHAEQGIAIYDTARHRKLAYTYGGHDCGVCAHGDLGVSSLALGYPDTALRRAKEGVVLAEALGHGGDQSLAVHNLLKVQALRRDVEAVLVTAEKSAELCDKHGPAHFRAVATLLGGWAEAISGDREKGLARARRGLENYEATGARLRLPVYLLFLAEALSLKGAIAEGLGVVRRALANIAETGERDCEAELYRMQGRLIQQAPAPAGESPEALFRSALRIAREQKAKFFELRAATDLARLLSESGRRSDAVALLTPIVNWFSEGADAPNIKDARRLLEHIA